MNEEIIRQAFEELKLLPSRRDAIVRDLFIALNRDVESLKAQDDV